MIPERRGAACRDDEKGDEGKQEHVDANATSEPMRGAVPECIICTWAQIPTRQRPRVQGELTRAGDGTACGCSEV